MQPPENSPINISVARPLPMQQPSFQHGLFNENLGNQKDIQQYPVWSNRSLERDLKTEIPNTFNSWNPWMKMKETNIPTTSQTTHPYSWFTKQPRRSEYANTITNMPADGTKQPSSVLTREQQLEIDRQIAYRLQEIELLAYRQKVIHLLKHRRVVANMIKRMLQHIHFRDSKISNEKRYPFMWGPPNISQPDNNRNGKGNLPPVGSTSHQQIRHQNRHYQNGAGLPYEQWQRDPAFVGSSNHQREHEPNRLWNQEPGESAFVQSHGQHQRVQQELQQQHTTPLARKPKRGQQNQRQNQRQTQHNWDHQVPSYNPKGYHNGQMQNVDPHHQPRQNNYGEYNPRQHHQHHQHQNFDFHNHRQFNQPWTSTPRDQNSRYNTPRSQSLFGETATNNSLLNILDTQCKVQQETTQALSTIIKLQDTWANDAFLSDLHSFNGKPDEFLKWISAIE